MNRLRIGVFAVLAFVLTEPAATAGPLFWTLPFDHIVSGNLDGTGQTNVIAAGDANGIAVGAGKIFWTNPLGNTIGSANLDGTGFSEFAIAGAAADIALSPSPTNVSEPPMLFLLVIPLIAIFRLSLQSSALAMLNGRFRIT